MPHKGSQTRDWHDFLNLQRSMDGELDAPRGKPPRASLTHPAETSLMDDPDHPPLTGAAALEKLI